MKTTTLQTITKQQLRMLCRAYRCYINSTCDDIYKAYRFPSTRKIKAFNWHRSRVRHGGIRIIEYNTWGFTVAYTTYIDNNFYFVYATKNKMYEVPLGLVM